MKGNFKGERKAMIKKYTNWLRTGCAMQKKIVQPRLLAT
jgi:hypothetical protein